MRRNEGGNIAKIIFTIEDQGTGGVSVVSKPPIADLLEKHYNQQDATSAEAYAIFVANCLREASKESEKSNSPILIPKVKGR